MAKQRTLARELKDAGVRVDLTRRGDGWTYTVRKRGAPDKIAERVFEFKDDCYNEAVAHARVAGFLSRLQRKD